jgi:hypothetical protein
MAAGMHHVNFATPAVPHPHKALVGKACLLPDRQGVHISTDHQHRPLPVVEKGDHPGSPYTTGDRESRILKFLCEASGSPLFLAGEFGMGMEVPVQEFQGRIFLVKDPGCQESTVRGGSGHVRSPRYRCNRHPPCRRFRSGIGPGRGTGQGRGRGTAAPCRCR